MTVNSLSTLATAATRDLYVQLDLSASQLYVQKGIFVHHSVVNVLTDLCQLFDRFQ